MSISDWFRVGPGFFSGSLFHRLFSSLPSLLSLDFLPCKKGLSGDGYKKSPEGLFVFE